MGLTGYYWRFIDHYAARTVNLTDALSNLRPNTLAWTEDMRQEFEDLKSALTGDTVLISPNFNLPFKLQTDASIRGIGAVLSQVRDQEERPVAYFSKKLNKALRPIILPLRRSV